MLRAVPWLVLVAAQQPPPAHERAFTTYGWCDCGTGRASVTVWVAGETYEVAVDNTTAVLNFSKPTATQPTGDATA